MDKMSPICLSDLFTFINLITDNSNLAKKDDNYIIMKDYCNNYLATLKDKNVFSDVKPGFLLQKTLKTAPKFGCSLTSLLNEINDDFIDGLTHFQHPKFHGGFPLVNSEASRLAAMFREALGCSTVSWQYSPAGTELELAVLGWLGRAIGLPESLLPKLAGGEGGACFMVSYKDFFFENL